MGLWANCARCCRLGVGVDVGLRDGALESIGRAVEDTGRPPIEIAIKGRVERRLIESLFLKIRQPHRRQRLPTAQPRSGYEIVPSDCSETDEKLNCSRLAGVALPRGQ